MKLPNMPPITYNPPSGRDGRHYALFLRNRAVSTNRYLFTSESVSMGHPDKVADQISDAILDHCLASDPLSRVACETMVTTDLAIVSGEITTKANLSRVRRRSPGARHHPRDRLRRSEHRLRGGHLPGAVPSAQPIARHRLRRGHRRGRRSGHDVRLRLQRNADLHAAADLPGPSPRREPREPAQERRVAVHPARRQEPGHGRVQRGRHVPPHSYAGAVHAARRERHRAPRRPGDLLRHGPRGDSSRNSSSRRSRPRTRSSSRTASRSS